VAATTLPLPADLKTLDKRAPAEPEVFDEIEQYQLTLTIFLPKVALKNDSDSNFYRSKLWCRKRPVEF
jgi:hypothetical protein